MTSSQEKVKKWQSIVQDFLDARDPRPLIVLIGPTASGKTALSIELAMWLIENGTKVEIVNADSRQLYKHLDIGTAKITKAEMKDVSHHLFSVLDPKESVSIAWYQREATRAIDELHGRNVVPILVGGSMLYVSSIVDGLKPVASDPLARKKLEEEYDRDQGISLHGRLSALDLEAAESIPRQNKVYVVRAMELISVSGKKKSESIEKRESPYSMLILGMDVDRDHLKNRISARIDEMFERGWIDEVKDLLAKRYGKDDPGMQSVGYREILEAIEKRTDPRDCIGVIATKTWQYAKRHITWWKDDPRVRWI